MEPPAGSQPARPPDPSGMVNSLTEGIPKSTTYAHTMAISSGRNVMSQRNGNSSVQARTTTHNGMPAVIFKAKDYYGVMAEECRLTVVGRFLKTRPQIDRIRAVFAEKNALKGTAKIGVFDNRNVFIDFNNEGDLKSVWFKRMMIIDGLHMWLTKWTPDWKPETDSPIVPAWVLLPELPYHLHTWHYVKQILGPIGVPLAMDNATTGRTRSSMAKVRVETDLSKPRMHTIWVGQEDEQNPLKGFAQKLDYETLPKFCNHCQLLGHSIDQCRVLERNKNEEKKLKEKDVNTENEKICEEGQSSKQNEVPGEKNR